MEPTPQQNDGPKLKWIQNECFEENVESPTQQLHPAFVVSKDFRLIPLVTGLPREHPKTEFSWELHKKGYFGIYIREDAWQLVDSSKPLNFLDAITATSILALPKEEAQALLKEIWEKSDE